MIAVIQNPSISVREVNIRKKISIRRKVEKLERESIRKNVSQKGQTVAQAQIRILCRIHQERGLADIKRKGGEPKSLAQVGESGVMNIASLLTEENMYKHSILSSHLITIGGEESTAV